MISVIIPHHLNENQHLLDEAIKSALEQDCDKEILVVADTKDCPVVPDTVKLHWFTDKRVDHFSRKINAGVTLAHPDSRGYMILSDDTRIIGNKALNLLSWYAIENNMIMNAVSNCDDINFTYQRMISDHGPDIVAMSTHRLYFYATMIPKSVWDKVGKLDERFESGWEDEDYCLRASIAGIRCGILLYSYIYHHKGQTIDKLPKSEIDRNKQRFLEKWGVDFIPPLTMPGFGAVFYEGLKALRQRGMF